MELEAFGKFGNLCQCWEGGDSISGPVLDLLTLEKLQDSCLGALNTKEAFFVTKEERDKMGVLHEDTHKQVALVGPFSESGHSCAAIVKQNLFAATADATGFRSQHRPLGKKLSALLVWDWNVCPTHPTAAEHLSLSGTAFVAMQLLHTGMECANKFFGELAAPC